MSKRTHIHVTDHAVVRYLERVGGFQIEELRRQIAERLATRIMPHDCSVLIDGHRYVLRWELGCLHLVTVLLPDTVNSPGVKP